MGEAKRRKQLDPNFGDPLYSRGRKADTRHLLAPAPPVSTADADPYEEHVKEVVLANQAALLQNPQGARNRLGYSQKDTDLCLIAMRTFDDTNQIRMKFARVEESKRYWVQLLKGLQLTATQIDTLFEEVLSKRSRDEFLWTHLDVIRTGLVTRLVPIEEAEIARICHL